MKNYDLLLKNIERIGKNRKIVIYPFGVLGQLAKGILNGLYNTQEYMIVDKYLSLKDERFYSLDDLKRNFDDDVIVLIVTEVPSAHDEIVKAVSEFLPSNQYVDVFGKYLESEKLQHKKDGIFFSKLDNTQLESNGMIYNPQKTNVKFYLPYVYMDSIQKTIFLSDDYYEIENIKKVIEFKDVKKKIQNGYCLDIGANIGNHTLFFAKELGAKVISFEPVYETFRILKKNININCLDEQVEIYNVGVSTQKGKGCIYSYNYDNIGGTSLAVGNDDADIDLIAIDEFISVDKQVSFMKIDVEGMELDVLKGAVELIKRCKPYIMLESFDKKFEDVKTFLEGLGYEYISLNKNADWLFYSQPAGTVKGFVSGNV